MTALLAKLRREPVAFYGGILSALLVILGFLGVDGDTIAMVGTVASLIGIPVTRARVTPIAKTRDDAGHAELHGVLALALGILIALIAWSVIGAHTTLY